MRLQARPWRPRRGGLPPTARRTLGAARAASLVELLNDLAEEHGLTLVISLHNLELAREYLPRLIGLRSGRVHFDQDSASIEESAFEDLYDLSNGEMLDDGGGDHE